MTLAIAVCTTFPDEAWDVYGKNMLESYVANWPHEVAIMVQLDTQKLAEEVNKIIRPHDGLKCGWEKDHAEFVRRNKDKDDPQDYRKQAVRFCHKVFALKFALEAVKKAKAAGETDVCRYLIWLDADVLTTRKVTIEDLEKCLPKQGDAVAYMGRTDWPHSECGWLAFDLESDAEKLIDMWLMFYTTGAVFSMPEWHDSWLFDDVIKPNAEKVYKGYKATNLTPNAKGMDAWAQSPMAAWSKHYKGPMAKQELMDKKPKADGNMQPLKIETCNSLPNESIQRAVLENQTLIKNWVTQCKMHDEEVVIVSAGPMLCAYDLREEVKAGRKIVAVKHALKSLKEVGIKPWACILLDPRDHVSDFVEQPDKDIIWFVASQVTPKATKSLLDAGCTVWGFHAAVGAGEAKYAEKQSGSVIHGGSATATRGLFLLEKLGFHKFRLYGYDLCLAVKPDLSLRDEKGQPRNFEVEMGYKLPYYGEKRWFWSTGELLAQADEFQKILGYQTNWNIKAFGNGIVPYLANIHRLNNLRMREEYDKMVVRNPPDYEALLQCKKKIPLLNKWRNMLRNHRLKPMKVSSF